MNIDEIYDETLRLASMGATKARMYMEISRCLVLAMDEAIGQLKRGRIDKARETLEAAQRQVSAKVVAQPFEVDLLKVVDQHCNGEKEDQRKFVMAILRELSGPK